MTTTDPIFTPSLFLAQRDATGSAAESQSSDADPATGGGGGGGFPMDFMFIMILLFVFMIVMSSMSGRKQRKKRAELMAGLEKQDKVQTIGGIIGTVQEIRDNEVILKVDETSGTRVRFSKSAIQQILKKRRDATETPAADVGSQPLESRAS